MNTDTTEMNGLFDNAVQSIQLGFNELATKP